MLRVSLPKSVDKKGRRRAKKVVQAWRPPPQRSLVTAPASGRAPNIVPLPASRGAHVSARAHKPSGEWTDEHLTSSRRATEYGLGPTPRPPFDMAPEGYRPTSIGPAEEDRRHFRSI
jgi:hypothetical protein